MLGLNPDRSRPEEDPEPLTEEQEAAAKNAFIAEVDFDLKQQGKTAPRALLSEVRGRIDVIAHVVGPEARYRSRHGGRLNAQQTAGEVATLMAEQAHRASFGPDPVRLLIDRVRSLGLGLSDAEIAEAARARIARLDDGRVRASKPMGKALHLGPAPVPGREYTDEELALFYDTSRAVEAATRDIVDAHQARTAAPSPEREQRDQQQRRAVLGGF